MLFAWLLVVARAASVDCSIVADLAATSMPPWGVVEAMKSTPGGMTPEYVACLRERGVSAEVLAAANGLVVVAPASAPAPPAPRAVYFDGFPVTAFGGEKYRETAVTIDAAGNLRIEPAAADAIAAKIAREKARRDGREPPAPRAITGVVLNDLDAADLRSVTLDDATVTLEATGRVRVLASRYDVRRVGGALEVRERGGDDPLPSATTAPTAAAPSNVPAGCEWLIAFRDAGASVDELAAAGRAQQQRLTAADVGCLQRNGFEPRVIEAVTAYSTP